MQKSGIFVEQRLKMNMLKIKTIVKLEILVIIQVHVKVLQVAYVI